MDEIYKRLNDDTEFEDDSNDVPSEVQEFFAGQTVFLTGSTGYVGKVLVEKLLRSCPGLEKIYFLVRPKKHPPSKRIKDYFNNVIFDRLKEEVPDYHTKITVIEGDLMKENLGLSEEDRATIIEKVTLIFHNASNVKFDEKISVSLRANVLGTKYMLDLAKECKRLLAFMYVSTAFTHTYIQHIDDKFYSPPFDMKGVYDILTADEENSRGIEERTMRDLRGKWPNNYAFTKSIAESLVEECGKKYPFACSVYRPSIKVCSSIIKTYETLKQQSDDLASTVVSSYLEPIRGWCGNLNGPVGAILGVAIGFIHAAPSCIYPMDFTPVDMCVNALITATWDSVVNREVEHVPKVYNYASSVEKPVTLRNFTNKILLRGTDIATMKIIGPFYVIYTKCIYYWWFLHIFTELFPALFADAFLILKGEKPQLFAAWKLLTKNYHAITQYVDGNWRIHVPNMRKVWDRLNKRDAKLFYSDLRSFDWDEYAYAYWAGMRVYMLKDPMSTQKAARRLFERLMLIKRFIYYLGQAIILYFLARWFLPTSFF